MTVLLMAGCSGAPVAAPEPGLASPVVLPTRSPDRVAPEGAIVVAYPNEPSTFLSVDRRDLAADDLQALWGLPLLRLDEAGQVRRGLVHDWTVVGATGEGWEVQLALRAGDWTDGTAVVAEDVVATLDAARARDPARFGAISATTAVGEGTVAVRFETPHAAWAELLVEVGTVLPATAWEEGVGTYVEAVPVSGGWYQLAAYEPGLRVRFEAHLDGPLGPPALERIDVVFTPRFETARGLLDEGDVDVLLGYVAVNGMARSTELDGVHAGSPLGGTTVSLAFRSDGALGGADRAAHRRGVAETVDVRELVEGMLGPAGAPATSPWPGVPGPDDRPPGEVREDQQLSVLYPADSEVLSFTVRAIQRDLASRGMVVDLVGEPAPRYARALDRERDAALVVHRTSPRPPLGPYLDEAEVARGAEVAVVPSAAVEEGLRAVAASARLVPLFRVGVLHAWRAVDGVRPSSWRGTGFWNVGEWRMSVG